MKIIAACDLDRGLVGFSFYSMFIINNQQVRSQVPKTDRVLLLLLFIKTKFR